MSTPKTPKFVVILEVERKIQILLETKDDQITCSYKIIWARNDSHGILGKKRKKYDKYSVNRTWI
jgi:hypothetical protein